MPFTYAFGQQFASEFPNFPKDQQDKVLDFLFKYEREGFVDFTAYEGKLVQSWSGYATAVDYAFALENELWHYHVGIPSYTVTPHSKYKTSDWVLHFQWKDRADHIALIDLYAHRRFDGTFYMPPASALL